MIFVINVGISIILKQFISCSSIDTKKKKARYKYSESDTYRYTLCSVR